MATTPRRAGAPKVEAKAVLEEMLNKRSQGRKQPGAWIGDAIYGVNDGLGAIFGIVSGVSGATVGDQRFVLLAGLSGMIALGAEHGLRRLSSSQERAGDLSRRTGPRARSHRDEMAPKPANCFHFITRSRACLRKTR